MKKRNILGVSLALLLASAASSQAVAIIVLNPSFESPGGGNGDYPAADNWVGSSFTEVSTAAGINTGGDLLRYNGQNVGTAGSQDLGVGFLANTVYTLTVSIAHRTGDSGNPTGTASFGLTAGGTDQGTFTQVTPQVTTNTFQDFIYTFTTGCGTGGQRWNQVGCNGRTWPVRQCPA